VTGSIAATPRDLHKTQLKFSIFGHDLKFIEEPLMGRKINFFKEVTCLKTVNGPSSSPFI
jgi:hypothetical protein